MDTTISMSAAARQAERLRQVRQHLNDMPHSMYRDELHDRLHDEASALSSRKLVKV